MSKDNKENRYDKVNFSKFKLPTNHKIIQNENVCSVIEQWPSFSCGRNIPINHILLNKNRLHVLNETQSKMPKIIPKPKFLHHLDEYVIQELKKHHISDNETNPVRLQIYREVFDWIIDAFKTYQPLLSKIKREYELHLSILGDEIRKLEPMKEILWTITEEKDQQILKMKQTDNIDIIYLNKEKNELVRKNISLHSYIDTLTYEIAKLTDNLGQEHNAYRREADSKKILITDINELKVQLDDIVILKKDKNIVEVEDSVMLRLALEEAKKAQSKALKELCEMKAIYADVVPINQFQSVNERCVHLLQEQKVIMDKLSHDEKQLRSLDEKYTALLKQRDFYYFKYMELARSPVNTPQTWEKITDFVSAGVDRWQEVSGKERQAPENAIFDDLKDLENNKKQGLGKRDSETSLSIEDKHDVTKIRSKGSFIAPKPSNIAETETKAIMRTMIEMMCELPPGSINPNFDPMNLLDVLSREKSKRETPKESKIQKKKHAD